MANKKDNRMAKRTRKALKLAYISLLHEKKISKITISEICARADLSRPAFYAHFDSKEDILTEYVSELLKPISEQIFELGVTGDHKDVEQLIENFFLLWQENVAIYKLVREAKLTHVIQDEYKEVSQRFYFATIASQFPINDLKVVEYLFSYYTGGLFSALDQWLQLGMKHSPKEMGKIVSTMFGSETIGKLSQEYSSHNEKS